MAGICLFASPFLASFVMIVIGKAICMLQTTPIAFVLVDTRLSLRWAVAVLFSGRIGTM